MKRTSAAFLLAFTSVLPSASAADLTLIDGRTFHDASIVSQTPRRVVIKHTNGLSGIEKTLLPAALSARYPVDEIAAREAERQTAEAYVRAEAFHQAEAERAARLRLEREQTALHNAQTAALETSQREAEIEAAAQTSSPSRDTFYSYLPVYGSYGSNNDCDRTYRSRDRTCEPRKNDRDCDDSSPMRHRRRADSGRRSSHTWNNARSNQQLSHDHSRFATRPEKEERISMKMAAAGFRR